MDPYGGDSSSTSTDNTSPVRIYKQIASNWKRDHMDQFMKESQSKCSHAHCCDCLILFSFCSTVLMVCSDGFSFAVKEVSYPDQYVEGMQIINRLEQVSDQVQQMTLSLSTALAVSLVKKSLSRLLLVISLSSPLFFLQAISLRGTFEHENIVQYYGT